MARPRPCRRCISCRLCDSTISLTKAGRVDPVATPCRDRTWVRRLRQLVCPATGYDIATGLGSPVGNQLIAELGGPSVVMGGVDLGGQHDRQPFGARRGHRRRIEPVVYVGRQHAAQRGLGADVQPQRQQRGKEHHGHPQPSRRLCLHGNDHRRPRPVGHQQRNRDGDPADRFLRSPGSRWRRPRSTSSAIPWPASRRRPGPWTRSGDVEFNSDGRGHGGH